MLIDIHSHILPNCDDGAKDVETSLSLLKMMKAQGITDVIATPHFYPDVEMLDEFKERASRCYNTLLKADLSDLPKVYLGCELFYFSGISKSEFIKEFTLNGSKYILLEPSPFYLGKSFINELLYLRDELSLIPIIPHIERYNKASGYKAFLKLIKENNILTQVNASSFTNKAYNKTIKQLFKMNLVTFVATDTHSFNRPPMMETALSEIEKRFSKGEKEKILHNNKMLYREIVLKENNDEIEQSKYL